MTCEHELYYNPYVDYAGLLWIRQKCRLCNSTFNCMLVGQEEMKLAIEHKSRQITKMTFNSGDEVLGVLSDSGSWRPFSDSYKKGASNV
jgi:hypothetical protein